MGFSVDSELQVEVMDVPPAEDQLGADAAVQVPGLQSAMEQYKVEDEQRGNSKQADAAGTVERGSGSGSARRRRSRQSLKVRANDAPPTPQGGSGSINSPRRGTSSNIAAGVAPRSGGSYQPPMLPEDET